MKKLALFSLLAAVTACLGVLILLITPNLYSRVRTTLGLLPSYEDVWYRRALGMHYVRLDRSVREDDVIFLGDSHIQGLNVAMVSPRGVNFGGGGQTSAELLERLPQYGSIARVAAVVLEIGFNDLKNRSVDDVATDIATIVAEIPKPVVLSAVPPINSNLRPDFGAGMNDKIGRLNRLLEAACAFPCTFVSADVFPTDSSGNLILHEGDGIHLSREGYVLWSAALSTALNNTTAHQ